MKKLLLFVAVTLAALFSAGCDVPRLTCTQNVAPGQSLSNAITNAPSGAVLCLANGTYSVNIADVRKSKLTTIEGAPNNENVVINGILEQRVSNLRYQNMKIVGGAMTVGPSDHLAFLDNEITGSAGLSFNGDDYSRGTKVTDVLIGWNNIHDIDYTGSQGISNGYGVQAFNGVARFNIAGNTIKSVAADYVQSASPVDFIVQGNTFLGPTRVDSHPTEHQDLWQIFGGGTNVIFKNNVVRNTGTHESLLFQEGQFRNVVVFNNLFDRDSRGYTCQLYESQGFEFRQNTIVGSRWGCLFRDDGANGGSGYLIDHNIAVGTTDNSDFSFEGSRIDQWCGGTGCDYNVSQDGSAPSSGHSVRNWIPQWVDTINYQPKGLPFAAGYRP